jgi:hypothetical protein
MLERVIKSIKINTNGAIFYRMKQYVACSNDVLIILGWVGAIEELLPRLQKAILGTGLVITEKKTKCMKININATNSGPNLITEGEVLERTRIL